MGTYTTNYNLFMPTVGETGWGELVNGNFTTIDTTMKRFDDVLSKMTWNGDNVTFPGKVAATEFVGILNGSLNGKHIINNITTSNRGIGTINVSGINTASSATVNIPITVSFNMLDGYAIGSMGFSSVTCSIQFSTGNTGTEKFNWTCGPYSGTFTFGGYSATNTFTVPAVVGTYTLSMTRTQGSRNGTLQNISSSTILYP